MGGAIATNRGGSASVHACCPSWTGPIGVVAQESGLGITSHMPSDTSDAAGALSMIQYNVLDSKFTVEIFLKLEIGKHLMRSCIVMRACSFAMQRG